ncbi:hypothetical protein K461DRAFT_298505 [Myriangium duriaei CBS 260.36]|uniref:Inhibitor I9 domain-containing protein n=1 Tax=Myriangium duriaei CBS 260.36 TaxID=1168546 RepID=A0A9P4IVQ1_9PEZI|nr:hypothetical protein K461DRAFT_298505 [Myriangium duriaei CBS 260.36]
MHFSRVLPALPFLSLVAGFDLNTTSSGSVSANLKDRSIITLNADVDTTEHLSYVKRAHSRIMARSDNHNNAWEGVTHNYAIAGFQGYAGHFPDHLIEHLKRHDDVASVEPDQTFPLESLA